MSASIGSVGKVLAKGPEDISTPRYMEIVAQLKRHTSLLTPLCHLVADYARVQHSATISPLNAERRRVAGDENSDSLSNIMHQVLPNEDWLHFSHAERIDERRIIGLAVTLSGADPYPRSSLVVVDRLDSTLLIRREGDDYSDFSSGILSSSKDRYYLVAKEGLWCFSLTNFELQREARFESTIGSPDFQLCDGALIVVASLDHVVQLKRVRAFLPQEDGTLLQISRMDCRITGKVVRRTQLITQYSCVENPSIAEAPATPKPVVGDFLHDVIAWLELPRVAERPDLRRRLEAQRVELDSIFPNTDLEPDQIDLRATLKAEVEALNNPKEGQ